MPKMQTYFWLEAPHGNSYCLYRRKGIKEKLFTTTCSKCSLEMVVPHDSHEGIDVQDDTIEQFATVRGI